MTLDRESELSLVADAPAAVAFLHERGGVLQQSLDGNPGVWWGGGGGAPAGAGGNSGGGGGGVGAGQRPGETYRAPVDQPPAGRSAGPVRAAAAAQARAHAQDAAHRLD